MLPSMEKTDSPVCNEEDENLSPEFFAEESESSSEDWWGESQRAAEEMRRQSEQERMLREREMRLRQMRAKYQMATHSFSAFEEEEEDDEDCHGFSLRATKRAWLRDMPKSVATPSSFRIVRTCVTEPNVVEVIVDFRRSNEL